MTNVFDDLLAGAGDGRPADTYRWATVTGTDPLRIRFDGEAAPVGSEPDTLVMVQVGQRVWVQIHGRMMIILGASQAPAAVGPLEWRGSSVNPVTATIWEPITTGDLASMQVDLKRKALVEVQLSSWFLSPTGNDLRAAIRTTGATTHAPNGSAWGAVMWSGTLAATYEMQSVRRVFALSPGVTNLELVAYVSGSGDNSLNYPVVTCRVINYI